MMITNPRKILWTLSSPLSVVLFMSITQAQEPVPNEKFGEIIREITYVEGKLSVNLKNAEMNGVLTEIGRVVKARVDIGGGIPAKISASFLNLNLEEGLAKLIKGEGAGISLEHRRGATFADRHGAATHREPLRDREKR